MEGRTQNTADRLLALNDGCYALVVSSGAVKRALRRVSKAHRDRVDAMTTSLDISGVPTSCDKLIARFPQLTNLTVAIRENDEGVAEMVEAVLGSLTTVCWLSRLQELTLENDTAMPMPVGIMGLSGLQSLVLRGYQTVDALSNLHIACTRLRTLEIADQAFFRPPLPRRVAEVSRVGLPTALETLMISCQLMTALPDSITMLTNLEALILLDSTNLSALPEGISVLTKLTMLDLTGCETLAALPDSISHLIQLRSLELGATSVAALPKGISRLSALECLDLYLCGDVVMSEGISGLVNLRYLNLTCSCFSELPMAISSLSKLEMLQMDNSDLIEMPQGISGLCSLQECSGLSKLPDSISGLSSLTVLNLKSCSSLTDLPASIGLLSSLRHLDIREDLKPLHTGPPTLMGLTSLPTELRHLADLAIHVMVGSKTATLAHEVLDGFAVGVTEHNCYHEEVGEPEGRLFYATGLYPKIEIR